MQTADIIGHAPILAYLERQREKGTLAHACLFLGQDGIGKRTIARRFASALLAIDTPERHPDYVFIERERDKKTGKLHGAVGIEQVRALTERLSMSALLAGWKVAILDGADHLHGPAANSLLKTLEEPAGKTVLILLAESADLVLPTIRSRCETVAFAPVPSAELVPALTLRGATLEKSELLCRLSGGRPGIALDWLRTPEKLDVRLAVRAAILDFPDQPVADRWSTLQRLLGGKAGFQETLEKVDDIIDVSAGLLRDAFLLACGRTGAIVNVDVAGRIAVLSRLGADRLAALISESVDAKRLLRQNVNPRLLLERFALHFEDGPAHANVMK